MHRLVVTSDLRPPLPIPGSAHAPNGLQKPVGGGQRGPGGTAHLCWEDRGALQNCAGRTRMRCRTVMEEALQICPGRTRVHWKSSTGASTGSRLLPTHQTSTKSDLYCRRTHGGPASRVVKEFIKGQEEFKNKGKFNSYAATVGHTDDRCPRVHRVGTCRVF